MRTLFLIVTMLCVLLVFTVTAQQPGAAADRKVLPAGQSVEPYRVEVAFNKTVHILFPAKIKYVDLGSTDIIAGTADAAGNVLRVKAAVKNFSGETTFTVITDEGIFYSFVAAYAENPVKLNYEMDDWLHDDPYSDFAQRQTYIKLDELGNETPLVVSKAMYTIYRQDVRDIKYIGSKKFGIQLVLRGIYIHENLYFLHTAIRNFTAVAYDIDYIRFRIVDKKVARRTAVQEAAVNPIRTYNEITAVPAAATVRNVFAFQKFTIPDDKVLVMEVYEKNGGRHLSFTVEHSDLIHAKTLNDLKIE